MINSLTEFAPRTSWHVVWSVAVARLRMMSRYRGWFLLDIIIPTMIAAIPILLGQAMAGPRAAENFRLNTGTDNYVAYLLIGSNVFMMVSGALWNFGFWLRREQQTGTLEALYLAPSSRWLVLCGVALYGTLRSVVNFVLAFALGCLLFHVNPFQGDILLALVFLLLGLVPLYGVSLLYGAVVLKLKEANALIQLAQWLVSFLMGIFFPIAVFPPLLRILALLFPPTWMNNGVRASLLGVGWFFQTWYRDLAVLAAFCVVAPLLGYWVFLQSERRIKANEGMGQF
ncbi:MAG: ABC transporter permease [Anaerolineae bacterium]|jgi:ABC-2 type transport system permease protein